MAVFDKQSVRTEFDKLKASFDEQVKAGKVSAELSLIFNTMMTLISLILSIFMEKATKKTSSNSSIPPSQTTTDDSATGNKPKAGSDKNKRKTISVAGNTRTVETITVLPTLTCGTCNKDLSDIKCTATERRTKIDIVFEKTEEHIDVEIKQCPACNTVAKAKFPDNMPGPLQYGDGIKAYVMVLLVMQMVSLKRVADMLSALIGRVISDATMLGFILRLYGALESWENKAKEQLLLSSCMHVDETSLRVDKKNHWVHVYSSGDITLKCLHQKRGLEAIEAIEIIPRYGGIIVHDCWASYLSYGHLKHGLCGSHLLRELRFIVDSNDYRWAKKMKRLLCGLCKIVSKRKKKRLTKKEYLKAQGIYQKILAAGEKELPPIPEKTTKRRGKVAKSDAHNLWERLKKYKDSVLLFAKLAHVPFTNNRAERDLRMTKVKQKVSGCFRTEKYAKAYCRISSYLQTMNNKDVNPLVAISMALNANIEL